VADDKLITTESQKLAADKSYAFTVKLKPGLIKYKVEFGAKTGGAETVLKTVNNLVCGDAYIIDGAYGGTPIWQHQRNPANHFDTSGEFYVNPCKIYGGLLTRVTAAKLTHGIRGVFWHQGENDSGSGAPTGDWNYKSYQQYFVDMSAAWKQDYPNIRNYYVFQVWPLPCSMGPKDDQIREAQRTLPSLYSNLRTMSTVGAASEHAGRGSCHFDLERALWRGAGSAPR
jgi:hypothetical protein